MKANGFEWNHQTIEMVRQQNRFIPDSWKADVYQAYVEKMVVEEKIIEKPQGTDAESIKVFIQKVKGKE